MDIKNKTAFEVMAEGLGIDKPGRLEALLEALSPGLHAPMPQDLHGRESELKLLAIVLRGLALAKAGGEEVNEIVAGLNAEELVLLATSQLRAQDRTHSAAVNDADILLRMFLCQAALLRLAATTIVH